MYSNNRWTSCYSYMCNLIFILIPHFICHVVTVIFLGDNKLLMTKYSPITNAFIFKYRYEGEQQQRLDDEVAAIKRIKKKHKHLTIRHGMKTKKVKYVCRKLYLD